MSDETAGQIEYLIEVTQQDIQIKAGLLADVVEGEILVSEMLQDIKLDVADIRLGLLTFFEEEQLRFKIQQNNEKEANFRRLEELRELSRSLITGNVVGGEGGAGGDAGGAGAVAGAVAGSAAGGAAAAAARRLITRIPQLALIAAAVSGVVDYMGSRPEILEKLRELGLEGQDLQTEATTQTLAKVMSDFSDNVVEPLVEPISIIAAKELGFNDEEIIGLRSDIKELSSVFKRGTVDLIDMFGRILGRESASAAQREDDIALSKLYQRFGDTAEEVRQSGLDTSEIETDMARLKEIAAEREEISSVPVDPTKRSEIRERQSRIQALGDEERILQDKLAPVLEKQRIEKEIRQAKDINKLSQAGYAAGELQTDTQLEFQQTPSDKKEEYYKNKIGPEIKGAIESGALSRSYYNTVFNAIQDYGIPFGPDSIAIPIVIEDFKKLEDLSPDQLKAILTNDDILLNSFIMRGALETSDREVVEQIYRIKVEGALDPRIQPTANEVPQLDAGGTIEPGQVAVVGERGPELVLGPAQVIGREDTARVLTPSPTISAAVPVNEMSSNMLAMSSAPVIISSTQGGSTVTNMVNNSSTTVLGGGAPARSSDVGHRRLQDRMQGVV